MNHPPVDLPIMVASENGRHGLIAAMQLLCQGGSALDAVEAACRIVEDDPNDHSVGFGGIPNLLGEVELDASIMDGSTLMSGAVAAVRGYANPISLARRVMTELPHVLLVGRGAERFAAELGQLPAVQTNAGGLAIWQQRFDERQVEPGEAPDLRARARAFCEPVRLRDRKPDPTKDDTLGTVNFLARDQQGNLASAVSTSGIAWKYPGRVGDSPIIGAGNYCDNRYGAVACTGMGELAIRAATARSVILYLKQKMTVQAAGLEALQDIHALAHEYDRRMNFVVLTPRANMPVLRPIRVANISFCVVTGLNRSWLPARRCTHELLLYSSQIEKPSFYQRVQGDGSITKTRFLIMHDR